MVIPLWLFIVVAVLAASGWIYALCGDLPLVKSSREVEVDFTFTCASSAREAYNRLIKYFYENREKFLLKKLKVFGIYEDHLVVKYKLIDRYDDKVDFDKVIGDILDNG